MKDSWGRRQATGGATRATSAEKAPGRRTLTTALRRRRRVEGEAGDAAAADAAEPGEELSSLRKAARGGWFRGPDEQTVREELAALGDQEKRALATAREHRDTLTRVAAVLATPEEILWLFAVVPYLDLEAKAQCFDAASAGEAMSAEQAWRFYKGLSEAEQANLFGSHRALFERVLATRSNDFEAVAMLNASSVRLADKLRLLDTHGLIAGIGDGMWQSLVRLSDPSELVALREDSDLYALFLGHAPSEVLPAYDRLTGLIGGRWVPADPADVAVAAAELSPAQRQQMRDSHAVLEAATAGPLRGQRDPAFRFVAVLGTELRFAILWLNFAGVLGELTGPQWGELLGAASPGQMATLEGAEAQRQLYETHCPEELRAQRAAIPEEPVAFRDFLTPAKVAELFDQLGAAGLLALVTRDGLHVVSNYWRIDKANHLMKTARALRRGSAMGDAAARGLRKWFFDCGEARLNVLELFFETRFDVQATGSGGTDAAGEPVDHSEHADLARWTPAGLRRSWQVLESLPPGSVEGNERWSVYLRSTRDQGGGYYWSLDDSIVISYQDDAYLEQDCWTTLYQPGGQYPTKRDEDGHELAPGSPSIEVKAFNSTIRHEIGHAVDHQLRIMTRFGSTPQCGEWHAYYDAATFVDAIIADFPGGLGESSTPNPWGYPQQDVADYRNAMIRAVEQGVEFQQAIEEIQEEKSPPVLAKPAPHEGPISVLASPESWHYSRLPWTFGRWVLTPKARAFHRDQQEPVLLVQSRPQEGPPGE